MNTLKCAAFGFAIALVAGCSALNQGPTMYHEVSVPREFLGGRGWAYAPSDHERYVEAYETAWWSCIEKYALDIDYASTKTDRIGVGWRAAVVGAENGFDGCEARIQENIRLYGKERTQEHLIEIWDAK